MIEVGGAVYAWVSKSSDNRGYKGNWFLVVMRGWIRMREFVWYGQLARKKAMER